MSRALRTPGRGPLLFLLAAACVQRLFFV